MTEEQEKREVNTESLVELFHIKTASPEEQTRVFAEELFVTRQGNTSQWIFYGFERLTGDTNDVQLRLSECLRAVYHFRVDLCVWWMRGEQTRYHAMINPFGMGPLRWVTVPAISLSQRSKAALAGLIEGGHFTHYHFDPDRNVFDAQAFRFTDQIRTYILNKNISRTWFRDLLSQIVSSASHVSDEELREFHRNLLLECMLEEGQDDIFMEMCSSIIQGAIASRNDDGA